jgi:glycosyltransferase involved in cell wall biosynthesis
MFYCLHAPPDSLTPFQLFHAGYATALQIRRKILQMFKVAHLTSVHRAVDIRIFVKECRSLAREGFHVTVVAPHGKDEIVEGVRIKAILLGNGLRGISRRAWAMWNVMQEALKLDADLYHFHDPELIPVGLLLRRRGKLVIYDIHENVPKDILLKQRLPKWSRPYLSHIADRVEVSASRKFSALVTVSPVIAKRFLQHNARTVLIHNYPDVNEWPAAAASSWDCREPIVVFPGGILPERGIREMVYAMACLPSSFPAMLEIASNEFPDDLYGELTQHPGWSRVRFLGQLNRSQIAQLLSRATAGLVLYLPEEQNLCAMPHKLFEYMAAGIPIIASDFPLWREVLAGVDCAVFVDPRKPAEISEAIQYLLSHPVVAERMGRCGLEAVQTSYNWDSQARELFTLYRGLMEPACAG